MLSSMKNSCHDVMRQKLQITFILNLYFSVGEHAPQVLNFFVSIFMLNLFVHFEKEPLPKIALLD